MTLLQKRPAGDRCGSCAPGQGVWCPGFGTPGLPHQRADDQRKPRGHPERVVVLLELDAETSALPAGFQVMAQLLARAGVVMGDR